MLAEALGENGQRLYFGLGNSVALNLKKDEFCTDLLVFSTELPVTTPPFRRLCSADPRLL